MIKDGSGTDISYDPTNIANINPLRYRGYYYDSELELYYLNARYYDPEIGRFINADDENILLRKNNEILDYNFFAYCRNNPVMRSDTSGTISVVTSWWGISVTLTSRETELFIDAVWVGSGAAWLAAELAAKGVVTLPACVPAGIISAALGLTASVGTILNALGGGKGISFNCTWQGNAFMWFN